MKIQLREQMFSDKEQLFLDDGEDVYKRQR